MAIPYELAAKITLQDELSGKLALIAKNFLHLDGTIAKIAGDMKLLGPIATAAAGGLAMLASEKIISGIWSLAKASDELLNKQEQLARAGVSYNEILRAQGDYYNRIARQVPTSTADQFLDVMKDLRAVTGSTAKAEKLAPRALQMNALINNTLGRNAGDSYYQLLRAGEMKGIATDPAKLKQFTDEAASLIIGFGGKLTAQDYQTFARRAGASWINSSLNMNTLGPLSVFMADVGGSTAGQTTMSLYQLMSGSMTLSKQQAAMFSQLGLLDMSKATATGFGGSRYQLAPGAIAGSMQFSHDLPGWIEHVLRPALEKASHGDQNLENALIAKIAPNRNAARMIQMFTNPSFLEQVEKDLGLTGKIRPVDQLYSEFAKQNPKGVQQAFDAQLKSLEEALGSPAMRAAIEPMRELTDFFTAMGAAANSHPRIFEDLFKGLTELSSAAFLGALGSLVAGPAGGLIGALVGALGSFVALNWDGLTKGFHDIYDPLAGLAKLALDKIGAGIATVFNALKSAWNWITSLGGLLKTGYDGGGFNPAYVRNASYETYSPDYIGGGGSSGGGGASIGIGGSGGVSGVGGGSGGHAATGGGRSFNYNPVAVPGAGGLKAIIDRAAAKHGIDPRLMYGIVAGESGHGNHYDVGDSGKSFGPFQMYLGGGLGNKLAALGVDVRNPNTIAKQADYVAAYIAKTHSLAPWHGFHGKRDWNPHWHSMGITDAMVPPAARGHAVPLHASIHMDGRAVASVVTRAIAKNNRDVRGASHFDGRAMKTPVDMNYQLSI